MTINPNLQQAIYQVPVASAQPLAPQTAPINFAGEQQSYAPQKEESGSIFSLRNIVLAAGLTVATVAGVKTHNTSSAFAELKKTAPELAEASISKLDVFLKNLNPLNWFAKEGENLAKIVDEKGLEQVNGILYKSKDGDELHILTGNSFCKVEGAKTPEKIGSTGDAPATNGTPTPGTAPGTQPPAANGTPAPDATTGAQPPAANGTPANQPPATQSATPAPVAPKATTIKIGDKELNHEEATKLIAKIENKTNPTAGQANTLKKLRAFVKENPAPTVEVKAEQKVFEDYGDAIESRSTEPADLAAALKGDSSYAANLARYNELKGIFARDAHQQAEMNLLKRDLKIA